MKSEKILNSPVLEDRAVAPALPMASESRLPCLGSADVWGTGTGDPPRPVKPEGAYHDPPATRSQRVSPHLHSGGRPPVGRLDANLSCGGTAREVVGSDPDS